jgi:hypothetical protein
MSYRTAGVDVHKVMAVVVSDVEVDGEHQFERMLQTRKPPLHGRLIFPFAKRSWCHVKATNT